MSAVISTVPARRELPPIPSPSRNNSFG
jgi:hypothetical protein